MRAKPLLYAGAFYALGLITGYLSGSGALRPPAPAHQRQPVPQPRASPTPPVKRALEPVPIPAPKLGAVVFEARKTALLKLKKSDAGVDYDTAQTDWIRPLANEPFATPRQQSETFDLNAPAIPPMPTGVYRIILKNGNHPQRIRDFVLVQEIELTNTRGTSLSLPSSLARDFIGVPGVIHGLQPGDAPVGFFCGLHVNIQENRGCMLMAFRSLKEEKVRYADLQPRPDTCWPISNLYLENPARLEFDCSLNHADYRVTLETVDGRVTVLPRFIMPETEQQRTDMLERMKALIRTQAMESGSASSDLPAGYDPGFKNLPPEEMPNFRNIASMEQFQRYLERISINGTKRIEIGAQVSVRRPRGQVWEFQLEPTYAPPRSFRR